MTADFHRVVLEYADGEVPHANIVSKPVTFSLNGAARQVSVARADEEGNHTNNTS